MIKLREESVVSLNISKGHRLCGAGIADGKMSLIFYYSETKLEDGKRYSLDSCIPVMAIPFETVDDLENFHGLVSDIITALRKGEKHE